MQRIHRVSELLFKCQESISSRNIFAASADAAEASKIYYDLRCSGVESIILEELFEKTYAAADQTWPSIPGRISGDLRLALISALDKDTLGKPGKNTAIEDYIWASDTSRSDYKPTTI